MIVIISPNVLSTQSFYTILNNIDGSGCMTLIIFKI